MNSRPIVLLATLLVTSCGGAPTPGASAPESAKPASALPQPPAPRRAPGTPLTDGAEVSFRETFPRADLGAAWNLYGVSSGKREANSGSGGLWLRVVKAEKNWDAVGARTARVRVEGDFDLRGRFRGFTGGGSNASAKLMVVDAGAPQGEAAYVERIQIDGKNAVKVGGEVDGTLETWGIAITLANDGDLRLVRKAGKIQGLYRTADQGPWAEIAPARPAPKSVPAVLKFGVKLSAESEKSAQVSWTEITMDGAVAVTP
jgi:hypothetical protein